MPHTPKKDMKFAIKLLNKLQDTDKKIKEANKKIAKQLAKENKARSNQTK